MRVVKASPQGRLRRLVLVLGDQLDKGHPLVNALDPSRDRVFMAEVREEAVHVWSHKARIVTFLSAMRHFRDKLEVHGVPVRYLPLGGHEHGSLAVALAACLLKQGDAVGVELAGGEERVWLPPRSGAAQLDAVLEVLGGARPNGVAALGGSCRGVGERLKRDAAVFLFSDFLDLGEDDLEGVRLLRARGLAPRVVHLLHADEVDLPREDQVCDRSDRQAAMAVSSNSWPDLGSSAPSRAARSSPPSAASAPISV